MSESSGISYETADGRTLVDTFDIDGDGWIDGLTVIHAGGGEEYSGNDPDYIEAGRILGRTIGEAGLRLVYGGGTKGIMGAVAEGTMEAGGKVIGIIPRFLMNKEATEKALGVLDELVVTEDMHERKHGMFEEADAFVTLPGGIGTLEEVIEIIEPELAHHLGQLGHGDPAGVLDAGHGPGRRGRSAADHRDNPFAPAGCRRARAGAGHGRGVGPEPRAGRAVQGGARDNRGTLGDLPGGVVFEQEVIHAQDRRSAAPAPWVRALQPGDCPRGGSLLRPGSRAGVAVVPVAARAGRTGGPEPRPPRAG